MWLFSLNMMFLRLIHVVACTSLLFIAKKYSTIWINPRFAYPLIRMQLFIHRCWVAFTFGGTMNSPGTKIHVEVLDKNMFSFLLGKHLG